MFCVEYNMYRALIQKGAHPIKTTIPIIAVCLLLSASWANAQIKGPDHSARPTVTRVVTVYDAATFTCQIDGLVPVFGQRVPVKIGSINLLKTSDQKSADQAAARSAKQFTQDLLNQARVITLENMRRDRYFRVIADVYVDGRNLAEMLIAAGLAKPTDTETKAAPPALKEQKPKTAPVAAPYKPKKPPRIAPEPPFAEPAQPRNARTVLYQLGQPIDLSAFTSDTPFAEAIDILRNATDPPLPIMVLWNDVTNNAFIERDSPIGLGALPHIRLETGLQLLLDSVSAGEEPLDYALRRGVIVIATKQYLAGKMVSRAYNLTGLMQHHGDFFFEPVIGLYGGYGGQTGTYGATQADRAGGLYRSGQNDRYRSRRRTSGRRTPTRSVGTGGFASGR